MTGLDTSHSSLTLWSLCTMTSRQTGTRLGQGCRRGQLGAVGHWLCLHAVGPARRSNRAPATGSGALWGRHQAPWATLSLWLN